jgi:hypothetical protein
MMLPEQSAPAPDLDEERLAIDLKRALQATVFTSNLRVSPRRVQQIALEIAATFRRFLAEPAYAETAYTYGQRLAGEGVGHRAMLALIEVLHRASWAGADLGGEDLPASVQCSSHLLAGYMAGREAYLLQEQERTRLALDRARAQATPGTAPST